MGPSAFRIAGLGERLTALGVPVVDEGDLVAPIPETKALRRSHARNTSARSPGSARSSTRPRSRRSKKGGFPLVLGGDHSLAAGSVAATADFVRREQKPLGLIWVDAHGDMNTPASSTSGNVHGMPLASLLGPEPAELSRIGGFSPKVLPEHTVLIGIRNLDEREKEIVRDSRVHVFTMKDIDRAGIAAVVEQALAHRRRRTPPACTCRSISTSAIRRSRPASARRSRAASTTARPTC